MLVLPLAMIGAGLVLRHELEHVSYADAKLAVAGISGRAIGLAVAFTIGSYMLLTLYNVLGLAHVELRLSDSRAALASFPAYVASHNLGLAGAWAAVRCGFACTRASGWVQTRSPS